MFKKFIAVFLVITLIFSFNTFAYATEEDNIGSEELMENISAVNAGEKSEEKKAIIIIPGITASELYTGTSPNYTKVWVDTLRIYNIYKMGCDSDGKGKYNVFALDDTVSTYGTVNFYQVFVDGLRARFDSRYGGTGEYEVRFFSYDWRYSNEESAKSLNTFIENNGYTKVILVGHSNGGVVASVYFAEYGYDVVEKFVSLGTPFYGAPQSLNVFQTGNFLGTGLFAEEFILKSFAPNITGIYELMPQEYTFQSHSGYIYRYKSDDKTVYSRLNYAEARNLLTKQSWFNEKLYSVAENLFSKSFSKNTLNGVYSDICSGKINTYLIVSYESNTLSGVVYNGDEYDDVVYGKGDGTVPIESCLMMSTSFSRAPYFLSGVSHANMVQNADVAQLVGNLIAGEGDDPNEYNKGCEGLGIYRQYSACDSDGVFEVKADGPITLEIYDKSGNFVGAVSNDSFDCKKGYENDFYLVSDNKIAFLENSEYSAVIKGKSSGAMELSIKYIEDEEISSYIIFSGVSVNEQSVMTIDVSTAKANLLTIDSNGDSITEDEIYYTESGIKNLKTGDVNEDGEITAIDLIRLAKYIANMNVTVNDYSSDMNGDEKISSVDLIRLGKKLAK